MRREKKSISFSDYWAFLECPLAWYLVKYLRMRQPPATLPQVIGNAVHAVAEQGFDLKAAEQAVERELAQLPAEDVAAARQAIADKVAIGAAMEVDDDDEDEERETKYIWIDPVTGWKFVAKPDKVMIIEEHGRQVLVIIDYKTSNFVKGKHKAQAFFFAMVVSRALIARGELNPRAKVRPIIRLLSKPEDRAAALKDDTVTSQPNETVLGFSSFKESELLEKSRKATRDMATYFQARNFPGKPGWYCKSCPKADTCADFAAYQKTTGVVRELPQLTRIA